MIARCLFCVALALRRHHPEARDPITGAYFTEWFDVPVCEPCHYADHAAQRDAGLDTINDPLMARLRRRAWFWGRLADSDCPVTLDPRTLRGLQLSELAVIVLVEDRR